MTELLETEIIQKSGIDVVTLYGTQPIVFDAKTATEFLLEVRYTTGSYRFVVYKDLFCHDVYNVASGVAGDIFKKFSDYSIKLALVGEWTDAERSFLQSVIDADKRLKNIFISNRKKDAIKLLAKKRK